MLFTSVCLNSFFNIFFFFSFSIEFDIKHLCFAGFVPLNIPKRMVKKLILALQISIMW